MANLEGVDLLQLAEIDTSLRRHATTEGGDYKGPCPNCGGKDRLVILPLHLDMQRRRRGQFFCRNCHPERGDAIEYLKHYRKMTDKEAFVYLLEMFPAMADDNPMPAG